MRDPWSAIRAADAVRVPVPRGADRFEPETLRPVRSRSVLPLATAAILTAGLVGALVVTKDDPRAASAHPAARVRRPGRLDARRPHPGRLVARGDLVSDRAFVRRAAAPGRTRRTAAAPKAAPPSSSTRAASTARRSPSCGAATGWPATRPASWTSSPGTGPSAPIALGGGRYLLAPGTAGPRPSPETRWRSRAA